MTALTVAARALCPKHDVPLEGGPVWFRCPEGHALPAADVDPEFHPREVTS